MSWNMVRIPEERDGWDYFIPAHTVRARIYKNVAFIMSPGIRRHALDGGDIRPSLQMREVPRQGQHSVARSHSTVGSPEHIEAWAASTFYNLTGSRLPANFFNGLPGHARRNPPRRRR